MSKGVAIFVAVVLVLLFVVPDPAASGAALGRAVSALVSFVRNTVDNVHVTHAVG